MLPLFIAEQVDPLIMLSIIGTKIAIGMIMGFAIDGALRLRVRSEVKHEEKRLRDLGHGVCCTHTENRENEHEHEHGRKCDREHESDHEHDHGYGLNHQYDHKNEHENKHEHGLDHDHGHERKAGVACSHRAFHLPAPIHTIIPLLAPVPMVIISPGQSSNSPFPIITATIPAAAFPKNQAAGKIS